jgi:hypothetical protein
VTNERWYTQVASIRGRADRRDEDWRSWFASELEDEGEVLDSIGQLGGRRPTGRYRFAEVEEAVAAFPGADWLQESRCPFVGRVLGFFSWDWWGNSQAHRSFVVPVLHAGRGCMGRTNKTGVFDFIVEEDFALAEAAHRSGGFHDGDFFWRNDPLYAAYVRGTINNAVEALGLTWGFNLAGLGSQAFLDLISSTL